MKKIIFDTLIAILVVFSIPNFSQIDIENKRKTDISFAHPSLLKSRVTILDVNGNVSNGFLIGLRADTLLLGVGKEQLNFALKELVHISIDIEKSNHKGLLLGSVIGIYLGSLTFLQSEHEPTAYLEEFEFLPFTLVSFLSGLAGGGIGYLIDKSSQHGQVEFVFSDNAEDLSKDIQEFKEFILGTKREKKIHLSVQLTQVTTRYSELYNVQDQPYYDGTSFNLLRSFFLTKSITNNINLGVAINWLGEPSIYHYDYNYNNTLFIHQKYEGIGYYAIGAYQPFSKTIDESVSFKLGLGVGIANIDFEHNLEKQSQDNYEYKMEKINHIEIKGIFLSGIVYSNIDYNLYNGLSFGLTVDYIYLPKKMPAIPEFKLESKQLGNYSIGVNFSIQF